MMIRNFLNGIAMGAANVVPGVSGGTLALILGFYQKLVDIVSSFFKNLKEKNFKQLKSDLFFLVTLGLGIVVGIVLVAKLLNFLLENHLEITMYAFLGLILGSLPSLFKRAKVKELKKFKSFVPGIITFLFSLTLTVLSFLDLGFSVRESVSLEFLDMATMFAVGLVAAGTMVIPGISGSFILMIFGFYHLVISSVSSILDFSKLAENLTVLLPFGVGVVVGIFAFSMIMSKLLKKFTKETLLAVIGFILGSLPFLAVKIGLDLVGVLAIVALFCGTFLSLFLSKFEKGEKN